MERKLTKEEKYIQILDAAETIIDAKDLDALTISKVAKHAKIAKGTVYLYFGSKEEIIAGLTIRARHLLLIYFQKYCDRVDDPIEKLKNIFWADYYFYKEQPTYHELVSFYEQNTGLQETGELSTASYAISMYVQGVIEYAKEKNAIRKDVDSGLHGFVFWGMAVGVLQIIETKKDQLQKSLGKSELDFLEYFIETSINSIRK